MTIEYAERQAWKVLEELAVSGRPLTERLLATKVFVAAIADDQLHERYLPAQLGRKLDQWPHATSATLGPVGAGVIASGLFGLCYEIIVYSSKAKP